MYSDSYPEHETALNYLTQYETDVHTHTYISPVQCTTWPITRMFNSRIRLEDFQKSKKHILRRLRSLVYM